MRHTFGALLLGVSFAAAVSYLAAGLHRAYRSRHLYAGFAEGPRRFYFFVTAPIEA